MKRESEPKINIENNTAEEKKSAINKVIGIGSEEEKQEIKDEFAKIFREQEFENFKQLKEIEIEKTPKQIEIINFVNNEINKLLKKHNLPKFNIPTNNIHLLKEKDYYKWAEKMEEEDYKKFKESGHEKPGQYCVPRQSIFINNGVRSAESDSGFANNIFHETTHFNTFQSFRNLETTILCNQLGITLQPKSGKILFNNLNEGLTTELEKRFYKNTLRKHSLFSKEIAENEKIIKENLQDEKIKSVADDIFDIKANTSISGADGEKSKTTITEYTAFGYTEERKILNTLIEKLYSKNKDKFQDKEQVFDLFVKSAFTGKLNWGGLVNRTFGKGTFKKLAHLDANVEEMAKFVDAL